MLSHADSVDAEIPARPAQHVPRRSRAHVAGVHHGVARGGGCVPTHIVHEFVQWSRQCTMWQPCRAMYPVVEFLDHATCSEHAAVWM